MEYYSALKRARITNFAGKLMYLECMPSEVINLRRKPASSPFCAESSNNICIYVNNRTYVYNMKKRTDRLNLI